MRGWQNIGDAFKMWGHLMGSNYEDYILDDDPDVDPEEECLSWFWWTLGEDTVYSKEFLEYLIQIADDVRTGKAKTYSMDEVMEDLKGDI
jgi:hypothetical protein